MLLLEVSQGMNILEIYVTCQRIHTRDASYWADWVAYMDRSLESFSDEVTPIWKVLQNFWDILYSFLPSYKKVEIYAFLILFH